MVFYGMCDLVWFGIVYYSNEFPCKVSNDLVWICVVLYGLTQLCTIFVLVNSTLQNPKSLIFKIIKNFIHFKNHAKLDQANKK